MSSLRLSGNLWHHTDFLKLWAGDTVTQFTSQVTSLAIPTIAILTLDVTGLQLGILAALGFIAFPTLGLFAGVWMDRVRRKRAMITVNIVRLITLATVPIAYLFNTLTLYQLYAVSFIMGLCTLFFDVAYQSYLPSLVKREDIVEGNQKLQVSASAGQVFGPSIAGILMGFFGAALSIIIDVMGFLVSILTLFAISKPETKPTIINRNFFAEVNYPALTDGALGFPVDFTSYLHLPFRVFTDPRPVPPIKARAILIDAFKSRLYTIPHLGHLYSLPSTRQVTYPHLWHVLDVFFG